MGATDSRKLARVQPILPGCPATTSKNRLGSSEPRFVAGFRSGPAAFSPSLECGVARVGRTCGKLHYAADLDKARNRANNVIANLNDSSDGSYSEVIARPGGSFTVSNSQPDTGRNVAGVRVRPSKPRPLALNGNFGRRHGKLWGCFHEYHTECGTRGALSRQAAIRATSSKGPPWQPAAPSMLSSTR